MDNYWNENFKVPFVMTLEANEVPGAKERRGP